MIQDFLASQHLLNPSALPVKVWVLAPHIESQDDNIDYYYDFSQSIAEYTKVFNELKCQLALATGYHEQFPQHH
jgi:hypothetical protein